MSTTETEMPPPAPKKEPMPQQRLGSGPGRFGALGMPAEKTADFRGSLKRLLAMLRRERFGFGAVVFLALASVSLSVIGPKILGRATDVIFTGLTHGGPSAINFPSLHRVLWFVVALYAGAAVLGYVQSYVLAGIVQRTMYRLRESVEAKLNRLPLRYVDGQARGDLLSRVTNDIDNLAQGMQQTLSQLLTSTLMLVGTLVLMFVVSWLLALVALVTIPLSIYTMKAITKRSRSKFVAQWRHTGALNALVEESFTGHHIVKAFGRQGEVEARFRATNEALHEASFGASFISGSIQPSMMVIGNLTFVAVAVVGGLRVAAGALTLGSVQAFIQYSRQFSQPLTQMASMVTVFQSGVASAERIFEFLDAEEEAADSDETLLPVTPAGCIEFERVSFAYDAERPLIENLSFVAQPGQTVAIVGPTGAGKTTLVNLIMRFYPLDGGRILLDGVDTATMARTELRSKIGMVLQDTWLFGGTIRDNIAYGNPDATEEQIREAAEATFVDRFVHSLPDGYDTLVSDEDGSISAGEKQLMTIARAFLADPAILILDEATSSVDTRTEVLIQEAMAALRSQRTSFVIAHRLSTIRDADVILVMENGSIVEHGSHAELLAAHGAYARLYQAQFTAPVADVA
ncbi:MAG: ATP-binding cassette, subfamily multidrug efflux pump [Actinomycetota bacterium]|nr:ATP-binding cassette, subfamily multidrug efflux pump [Actinomycetota bacterium]